jgi:hypothetical protein
VLERISRGLAGGEYGVLERAFAAPRPLVTVLDGHHTR